MKKIVNNRRGQGLVEYALIVGAVAVICLGTISIFGTKVSNLIGTYAALLPANSAGTLNKAVGVGSFMEIDVAGTDIKLDGNAITAAVGTSRFEVNQDLANGNIALLYAAGGSITGAD